MEQTRAVKQTWSTSTEEKLKGKDLDKPGIKRWQKY